MTKPIVIMLPCKVCNSPNGRHLPSCPDYGPLTSHDAAQTRASSVIEFVHELSIRSGNNDLSATVHRASGHELFVWWHEAQALSLIESASWGQKLASAVGSVIASECVRRCEKDHERRSQV